MSCHDLCRETSVRTTAEGGRKFRHIPRLLCGPANKQMNNAIKDIKRVTTHTLQGEAKAYSYRDDNAAFSMARLLDGAGVDVMPLGDSASNVMAGHETTCLPITLDK